MFVGIDENHRVSAGKTHGRELYKAILASSLRAVLFCEQPKPMSSTSERNN
jgi:hypothetical protein